MGTNSLPENAVQENGDLIIKDVEESNAGQYRCTATGSHQFATDDATLNVAHSSSSFFFLVFKQINF